MADFEHETVSMEDLRAGFGTDLLTEADVVIAVDADAEETVVEGATEWEPAVAAGNEAALSVVRVEIDEVDDVDELKEMIERERTAESDDEPDEEPADDDD